MNDMERDTLTSMCCRGCDSAHRSLNGLFCRERKNYVEYPSQRDVCPLGKFPERQETLLQR